MNPSSWIEAAAQIWKFIWVPLVLIFLAFINLAWVTPDVFSLVIFTLQAWSMKCQSTLNSIISIASTYQIELVPSAIAYAIIAILFHFLGGPFYVFLSSLPPLIGWFSGRSLQFATTTELAALRRKYSHANSNIEAYSFACEELRLNETYHNLFVRTTRFYDYLMNFAKFAVLSIIISAAIQASLFGYDLNTLARVILALIVATIIWSCAAMFFVNDIAADDFAIFETIRRQLHTDRNMFETDSIGKIEFSENEVEFLKGKWWYIRYASMPSMREFFKTFFCGFNFRS